MLARAEAVIDTAAIRKNYSYIKSHAEDCDVICVVKADAYGHGAPEVCRVLAECGCGMFAVACIGEAKQLREAGVKQEILILGNTPAERASELATLGVIQEINSREYALALSRECASAGCRVRTHIKVDTGMSRLGIYCHTVNDVASAADDVAYFHSLDCISCEGIFTHFACADDITSDMPERQYAAFSALLAECVSRGINLGIRHCCNSAAIFRYPHMHLDAVRAGILIYGLTPDGSRNPELIPAMRFVARIGQITHLRAGDTVSYNARYTAEKEMDIAAISIGYADGYSRALTGKGKVVINGRTVPIVGKICMDMCMADVTGIPCAVGDEAELFGRQLSVDDVADSIGTVNYDLVCAVKERVERRYI